MNTELVYLLVLFTGIGVGVGVVFLRVVPFLRSKKIDNRSAGELLRNLQKQLDEISIKEAKNSSKINTLNEEVIKKTVIAQSDIQARAVALLQKNLKSNIEIKSLNFKGANIFAAVDWQLSPHINIMLGRNGFGKSYLLHILVALLSYDNDRVRELIGNDNTLADLKLGLLRDGTPEKVEHKDGVAFEQSIGKVPLLAIPDARFINRESNSITAQGKYADLAEHGAQHFLYNLPFESTIATVLAEICIEVISKFGDAYDNPSTPQVDLIESVIYQLSGEKFKIYQVRSIGGGRFSILVETPASPGHPITIQQASQGTLSVIAMFGLIYQFLVRLGGDTKRSVEQIMAQKAIVIIDEVDAHLHPEWQRKIVHLLRKHFPSVQFIMTAHSPLVVGGSSYGEISVLRRAENGLELVECQQDFIGWSTDKIYQQIFHIEKHDPTYLEHLAQLPAVKELNKRKQMLNPSIPADEQELKAIERQLAIFEQVKQQEDDDINADALKRENTQLKRQLSAMRRQYNTLETSQTTENDSESDTKKSVDK
ncbi:MAG: energy-coupling factor transporter ATP-binding protein EcfA2 [Phenylobacterium sp.]|jgi:energy-coupling factor transporter ATP-binding protein EcfA2